MWVPPSLPALPAGIKASAARFSPGSGHRKTPESSDWREQLWAQGSLGRGRRPRPPSAALAPMGLVAGRSPSRHIGHRSYFPPTLKSKHENSQRATAAPSLCETAVTAPGRVGPQGEQPEEPTASPSAGPRGRALSLGQVPCQSAAPQDRHPSRKASTLAERVRNAQSGGPAPGSSHEAPKSTGPGTPVRLGLSASKGRGVKNHPRALLRGALPAATLCSLPGLIRDPSAVALGPGLVPAVSLKGGDTAGHMQETAAGLGAGTWSSSPTPHCSR